MTKMMNAILPVPGEPLKLGEIERPECGPNDILIEVKAAGMNRADLIQQAGRYPAPPGASKILGLEVAGIVAEIGADVSRWKVGDEVCALLAGGGYAQFAAVDQGSVLPIPAGMDMVNACCLPEAMFTVWANVFSRAALVKGEDFLCHGGTSGIGVMAIQMARLAGAKTIFATAGTEEKCQLARDLGADTAINYRSEDFEEVVKAAGGVDVILDMVGGAYVQKNIGAAKLNGRIVNIAYQDGFETTVNFGLVLMKRLTITATTLRARTAAEKQAIRDVIETDFWGAVNSGDIKPVLDSIFPLANAGAAHEKMAAGGHSGKIILEV